MLCSNSAFKLYCLVSHVKQSCFRESLCHNTKYVVIKWTVTIISPNPCPSTRKYLDDDDDDDDDDSNDNNNNNIFAHLK